MAIVAIHLYGMDFFSSLLYDIWFSGAAFVKKKKKKKKKKKNTANLKITTTRATTVVETPEREWRDVGRRMGNHDNK